MAENAPADNSVLLQKILASVQALAADVQYVKAEVASIKSAIRESNFDASSLIDQKLDKTHEKLVEDMLLVGEVMRNDLRAVQDKVNSIDERVARAVPQERGADTRTPTNSYDPFEEQHLNDQQMHSLPQPIARSTVPANKISTSATTHGVTTGTPHRNMAFEQSESEHALDRSMQASDLRADNRTRSSSENSTSTSGRETLERDWAAMAALTLRKELQHKS